MFLSPATALRVPTKPKYPGDPLRAGEIRVLRLQPGKWTDAIVCELSNAKIGSEQYRTLSYVWGSQFYQRFVRLNGRSYPITLNLESALRNLRAKYDTGLILWVDALCIDQANGEERTHQVQLMGRIYANCQECLVYLGQSLDSTVGALIEPTSVLDFGNYRTHVHAQTTLKPSHRPGLYEVFEFFYKLSESNHLHETLPAPSGQEKADTNSKNHKSYRNSMHFFETLRMFMHAPFTPWWTRIWVIQEVALPPKVVIFYGTISAPWTMFAKATKNYRLHSSSCCRRFMHKLPRDEETVVHNSFEIMSKVEDLRQRYHMRHLGMDYLGLLELLRLFRDKKASDPKDKVFALLSMVEVVPGREPLVPDYSLSEKEVYLQATLESIYSTKSLSVFSTELGRKFRSDLPSWVPDWGAPGSHTYDWRAKTIKYYNACEREATPDSIIPIGSFKHHEKLEWLKGDRGMYMKDKLSLQGLRIMRVEKVGEIMWGDDPHSSRHTLLQWCRMTAFLENTLPVDTENMQPSQRVSLFKFWRTMCADVIHEHVTTDSIRRVLAEDMSTFEKWMICSNMSPFSNAEDRRQAKFRSIKAELWSLFLFVWPTVPDKGKPHAPESSYVPTHLKDRQIVYNALLDLIQADRPSFQGGWGTAMESGLWGRAHRCAADILTSYYGPNTDLYMDREWSQVPSIERSVSIATLSRRLICGDGLVGLGPADMAVGDEIFLLPGGKTPFVLRLLNHDLVDVNGEETVYRPNYEIIGDCYLDGWMDGDAQVGSRAWTDIVIV
ncbi:hypothetical protein COCC4DRAFT_191246 [Bipolaris maydis ATCC 48331]|uniref:Heterokaryon incompatibility domain-containing protein n=2 Tax=Cochliobolus heterostrophus TaxID=5016 RepID=M2T8M3_COCH5|nr:uncharacterized protein COCC4DRAFT_191246 [Bipolaris maydis ATCC 48331]EMD93890.1 hypothetical protein COCHEDRAFT_1192056 [Bipolaris maydis C5]KAJ5059364.1 heterokaryon incompatibility protein-domain-containing protein [Bipolaris maydis]ENI07806.1 hypothetical protein COCC4DRAFT_191246 [Bipolaris maydis ATCC 48331]KAJ6209348.1 heterokaryon incompatibility protein-domain-containing protein [Bipolaris maydis]KAJ6271643.1 heterokaryon incompatibility protein-domain-containing protein [Bipolari